MKSIENNEKKMKKDTLYKYNKKYIYLFRLSVENYKFYQLFC